jgi:hypothetical protein
MEIKLKLWEPKLLAKKVLCDITFVSLILTVQNFLKPNTADNGKSPQAFESNEINPQHCWEVDAS